MDTTPCISNETWERYAAQTLDGPGLLALETHVQGCELCADIKEGIDAMKAPQHLADTVADINRGVDEYLEKGRKKRIAVYWWYSSAAAVVLLAVAAGMWFKGSTDGGLADTPTPVKEQTVVKEQKSDTGKPTPETTESTQTQALKKKSVPGDKSGREINTSTVIIPQVDNNPVSKDKGTIVGAGTDLFDKKKTAEAELEKVDITRDTVAGGFTSTEFRVEPLSTTVTEMTLPANMFSNTAILTDNNNNYTFTWNAVAYNLDSSNYYTAVKYYSKKQYDTCFMYLESLAENAQSKYYEDALLLKAKAYIDQGKTDEAKPLLQTLVGLKKKRAKEARTLLNRVK